MSFDEMAAMVSTMTGENDPNALSAYLAIAGDKVCRKAYPYDPSVTEVPERYKHAQVEIAAYLLNKRGAEGQTAHGENGVNATYEDGDVPPSLLRDIVPFAGVIGG